MSVRHYYAGRRHAYFIENDDSDNDENALTKPTPQPKIEQSPKPENKSQQGYTTRGEDYYTESESEEEAQIKKPEPPKLQSLYEASNLTPEQEAYTFKTIPISIMPRKQRAIQPMGSSQISNVRLTNTEAVEYRQPTREQTNREKKEVAEKSDTNRRIRAPKVAKVIGFPLNYEENEIRRFFGGFQIQKIFLHDLAGFRSDECYVEFETTDDLKMALKKSWKRHGDEKDLLKQVYEDNHKLFGRRFAVEVESLSTHFFKILLEREEKNTKYLKQGFLSVLDCTTEDLLKLLQEVRIEESLYEETPCPYSALLGCCKIGKNHFLRLATKEDEARALAMRNSDGCISIRTNKYGRLIKVNPILGLAFYEKRNNIKSNHSSKSQDEKPMNELDTSKDAKNFFSEKEDLLREIGQLKMTLTNREEQLDGANVENKRLQKEIEQLKQVQCQCQRPKTNQEPSKNNNRVLCQPTINLPHPFPSKLLKIEPDIAMVYANCGISQHTLRNTTNKRLAFKVKMTNVKDYRVVPVCGVVEPNATGKMSILRQDGSPGEDTISVQYVVAPLKEIEASRSVKSQSSVEEVRLKIKAVPFYKM